MKLTYKLKLILFAVMFVVFFAPMANVANAAIVKCGTGSEMCTLCDIIKGFNIIIKYLMQISVGVALLAISIGAVMYVVSGADKSLVDTAKKTITNALVGFVLIFAAYLIVNTTIQYIGTKPGMGVKTPGSTFLWSNFECAAPEGK